MAYRYGNRPQQLLLPPSIENYVPADAPVRAYDAFVEALDFGQLGIELDSGKVGNSSYDPKAMLKLLVYGYSYGVRSPPISLAGKLERETHYNLSFIWLTGGLKPDHKLCLPGVRPVLKLPSPLTNQYFNMIAETMFMFVLLVSV